MHVHKDNSAPCSLHIWEMFLTTKRRLNGHCSVVAVVVLEGKTAKLQILHQLPLTVDICDSLVKCWEEVKIQVHGS